MEIAKLERIEADLIRLLYDIPNSEFVGYEQSLRDAIKIIEKLKEALS